MVPNKYLERDVNLERLYLELYMPRIVVEHYDADEYFERLWEIKSKMVHAFLDNPKGKWVLKKVPADRVKKIWLEFGKRGTISDINGLDKIATSLIDGICALRVATQLQGHTDDGMSYAEIFDEVLEWDEETTRANVNEDDLYNFLTVHTGESGDGTRDFLSDYGLRPLERLIPQIGDESDPEKRLYAIDKAFNVIHQRSDLASFFIDGGSKTLRDIYMQGGYQAE